MVYIEYRPHYRVCIIEVTTDRKMRLNNLKLSYFHSYKCEKEEMLKFIVRHRLLSDLAHFMGACKTLVEVESA